MVIANKDYKNGQAKLALRTNRPEALNRSYSMCLCVDREGRVYPRISANIPIAEFYSRPYAIAYLLGLGFVRNFKQDQISINPDRYAYSR
jgi:hypothetical protein